jgi:hypothetical protein
VHTAQPDQAKTHFQRLAAPRKDRAGTLQRGQGLLVLSGALQ